MAYDYSKLVTLCQTLIAKFGREVTLYKLDATAAAPTKPWRGPGVPTTSDAVPTRAAFVVPQTSIPTESRGLAFDWIDDELLKRARHVCIIAAKDLPVLDEHKLIEDGGRKWRIIWGQCLQPGADRLIYVFGVIE